MPSIGAVICGSWDVRTGVDWTRWGLGDVLRGGGTYVLSPQVGSLLVRRSCELRRWGLIVAFHILYFGVVG